MHVWIWFVLFYGSGRTEEEVLKKAAQRFKVAPEKITLKQGELSSYAEVNDFFEAFADYVEIMALLEISSVPENETDHVLASWRHSMCSEDQGYLPVTWEIQKSRMENQIVRAILFMFMHKISTRVIRVNGTCEYPWPRYFDGRKKEQFIPLLISYDRWRCRNVIKRRIIWHQLLHDFLKLTLLCCRWGRTRHVVLLWLVPVLHIWLAGRGNDSLGMFFFNCGCWPCESCF